MTDFFWPDLPPSPEWHARAACDGRDPTGSVFFPDHGKSAAAAKEICAGCPVVGECLAWALEHEDWGVFGGMTANERAEIRRARRAA